MSFKRIDTNNAGETIWTLLVPEEHCASGLEINTIATESGIRIGDQLISWGDLEKARKEAQRNLPF